MQLRKLIWILITLAAPLAAQSPVAVTATITGANAVVYANGTYQTVLVDANGNQLSQITIGGAQVTAPSFTGNMNSSGALSLNLYKNSDIQPTGSKWKFSICSMPPTLNLPLIVTAQQCFTSSVVVSGAGDLSSTFSAVAPAVYITNPTTGANPAIDSVTVAPTGSCTAGLPNQQVLSTGNLYSCQSGIWAQIGASAATFTPASQQYLPVTTPTLGLLNQAPNGNAPVWNRMGVAIDPRTSNCSAGDFGVQERAIMYEAGAPIVANQPFEMWYHSAWATSQISLATSADGVAWNCQGLVLSNYTQPRHVWRDGGGNVVLYSQNGTTMVKNVSANGQSSWTNTNTNLTSAADPYVWQENSQTFVLYTISSGGCFQTNFAYSSDGLTGLAFTNYSGNPIITTCASGSFAGYKDGSGNYWLWGQGVTPTSINNGNIPDDIYVWKCTGFTSLSPSCSLQNSNNPATIRKTADEGVGSANSQIADPAFVTDGTPSFSGIPSVLANKTIMTYTSVPIQSPTSSQPAQIKEVIANMSLATLVGVAQSDGPPISPDSTPDLIPSMAHLPSTQSKPITFGSGDSEGSLQYGNYGPDRLLLGSNAYISDTGADFTYPISSWGAAYFEGLTSSTLAQNEIGMFLLNPSHSLVATEAIGLDGSGNTYRWSNVGFECLGTNGSCPVSISSRGSSGGAGSQPWLVFGNGTFGNLSAFLDFSGMRNQEIAQPSGFFAAGYATLWPDSTAHRWIEEYAGSSDTLYVAGIVAQGTSTLSSGALSAGTCASAVSTAATNAATTDSLAWAYASTPATADALLIVTPYMSSGHVNFLLCNPTASSRTPSGLVINWSVIR